MTLDAATLDALTAIVGVPNVVTDEAARKLASNDLFVWPGQVDAAAVVRPASTEECSRVMAVLAQARLAVVPRGAGLSYTGGGVPHTSAVVIDSTRMNAIDIHADDLYAVVGAGVVWENLSAALKPHGLRPAQGSPISGAVTTVGGLASNGLPGGLDGMIGVTVVLADGTVARTGAGAISTASPFQRYAGPDLTGLFLGDCGAFGVKTEVVLRLVREKGAAFASFAFERVDDMLAAMTRVLREGLVTRAFSLDQAKAAAAAKVELAEAAKIVGSVLKSATSIGAAIRDVAQLARGAGETTRAPWSLHLVVEAPTEAIAEAQLDLARAVCRERGREIDNVVPKTMRAKPYSIRGFVGVEGERWVPIHGLVPLSRAVDCFRGLQAALATRIEAMEREGILHSWLISSQGAYVTIEPMFYWRDALDPIHHLHLSDRNRERFGGRPENPSARALVRELRVALRDVMDANGAVHAQVGRFYRYPDVLAPGTRTLIERVRRAIDPDSRVNPGVLGLDP